MMLIQPPWQCAWLARKLQFSLQFKAAFQEICGRLDAPPPHNMQHNVVACWNSTKLMIKDVLCLEEAM
jgi:hypothetical protein